MLENTAYGAIKGGLLILQNYYQQIIKYGIDQFISPGGVGKK